MGSTAYRPIIAHEKARAGDIVNRRLHIPSGYLAFASA
jgi:hypothetical protein